MPAWAETLIYNNSVDSGYYYPAGSYNEIVDYGTSSGGNVTKFTIGYSTTLSNPGIITIRFYRWVNEYTDPDDAVFLKSFQIGNLPGYGTHYRDYLIPAQDQFTLASGDFGYSYELTNSSTGPVIASGGAGNEDNFWEYNDLYEDWWWTSFGGNPHAGFYMKIYAGPAEEEDPNTCDISGYKFDDVNGNSVWDGGEPNIPGWEIYLDLNGNGTYDTSEPNAITDPNGMYRFTNLDAPATYRVREVAKDGWTQTLPGGPDNEYFIDAEPNNIYGPCDFGNTDQPILTDIKLSGYAKTSLGVRIKGINISASTGETTVTDALGYYELTLPNPFSGTITPSQTDWTFSPTSRPYSNTTTDQPNQNFTATYSVGYGGGAGTLGDPYRIYTAKQMNAIGTRLLDWDNHFKLMNSIDLGGFDGNGGNPSFNRIGYYINFVGNYPFTGVFDGNGHTISNFTFDSNAGNDGVGIFGHVDASGAEVKDVKLYNIDINSTSYIGTAGLIGHLDEGTISGCAVEDGSVHGDDHVGGLVGSTWGGTISDCSAEDITVSGEWTIGGLLGNLSIDGVLSDSYASCTVTAKVECGGLVGAVSSSTGNVTRCTSAGNVSINYEGILDRTAGGLVGENRGTIDQCYSTANVTGNGADEIGGLAGRNFGIILDSYAAGDVSGTYPTGGLVGVNVKSSSEASITNCYSTGASTGGGLIGLNIDDLGPITNSFWDKQTSGTTFSDGGTGLFTADIQTRQTFLDAGWDFVNETANGTEDIWHMPYGVVGSPQLWWHRDIPGDWVGKYGVGIEDYAVLAGSWMNINAEINLSGSDIIDLEDLTVFVENWLERR